MTTFIYALCCPESGYIRYIGKADRPMVRYLRHLSSPEIDARCHKANWIRKLRSNGLRPFLTILEEVPSSEWQLHERKWIDFYRSKGVKITNCTRGGDGVDRGTKHSPEVCAKISAAHKGRKASEETRKKMSSWQIGRKMTEEAKIKMSEVGKRRWESLDENQRLEHIKHFNRDWPQHLRDKVSKAHLGRKRVKGTTSIHVGVSWFKRDQCWRAYCRENGRQKHIGYFKSEDEAKSAYQSYFSKLHTTIK